MMPNIPIDLFGHRVRLDSYTVFAVTAAIIGCLLSVPALRRCGLSRGRILALLMGIAASFLIGARLLNVAVNPANFRGELRWYSPRLAGFSLYGGLGGGAAVVVLGARRWKLPVWKTLDAFTVPCALAFMIARVGCFCAGCCAGKRTNSPLGVVFLGQEGAHQAVQEMFPLLSGGTKAVLPTQLFELAGALLSLAVALWMARRLFATDGARALVFGVCFCIMRLCVLPFRVFTYEKGVVEFLYPALYLALAFLGAFLLYRQSSRRKPVAVTETEDLIF